MLTSSACFGDTLYRSDLVGICLFIVEEGFHCIGVGEDNVKVDGDRMDQMIIHYDYLKEKLIASLVFTAYVVVF